MDNIGVEVGQKMRSAIKAKLTELGCYVDDELPDYIMVMVANKRTKSQMNEDLHLFLKTKTAAFVDWLQIVLKKLKEITVTNPDIYKRVSKRKSDESPKSTVKVKKEKKDKIKSAKKSSKKKDVKPIIKDVSEVKSLTDDLPVEASKLSEMRKIIIMQENQNSNSNMSNIDNVNEDSFDIPPLSEVAMSNENELEEIERKIKSVKSRLGLQVHSDSEDEDFINLKVEPDDLFPSESTNNQEGRPKKINDRNLRKIQLIEEHIIKEPLWLNKQHSTSNMLIKESSPKQKNEHPRITFGNETPSAIKKPSIMERLGKRQNSEEEDTNQKRTKINLINIRREEEEILRISKPNIPPTSNKLDSKNEKPKKDVADPKTKRITSQKTNNNQPRESALRRLGVMSKVAVPQKEIVEFETEIEVHREVPSVIKVKPRVLPPPNNQANKNLLLKAVAEAQRSIAQTPVVGTNSKPDALFTKKYREKSNQENISRKISNKEKEKIRSILVQVDKKDKKELKVRSDDEDDDDNLEYIPKPVKKTLKPNEHLEYIPSIREPQINDYNFLNTCVTDKDGDIEKKVPKEKQTFVITLDGIVRRQDHSKFTEKVQVIENEPKVKDVNENKKRKSPSPIIFGANTPIKTKSVQEKLAVILPSSSIKTKEKCKYWPACRQGDKCDFVHPSTACKLFPQCKFGEKCLYIHPMCKFETSCTRKECPYSHVSRSFSNNPSSTVQMCKFYPNCNNIHCMFFHPKPCKYGKYCKNQSECNFSHTIAAKNNFIWRSTLQS